MDPRQHPLDTIVGISSMHTDKEESAESNLTPSDVQDQSKDNDRQCSIDVKSAEAKAPVPRALSLTGLKTPAIIMDSTMRVVWQNKMAIDQIWHCSPKANNGNPTPDIFDLLFDPHFQHSVDNWRQWVAFFIQQVIEIIPAQMFESRVNQMPPRQMDMVKAIMGRIESGNAAGIPFTSRIRQVLPNGDIRLFNATVIDFVEGRLFAFVQDTRTDAPGAGHCSHDVGQRFDMVRRHPNPIKIGFSVLSACMNNGLSLKTELLSHEYCLLVNDVCRNCIDTIERFGGIFLKHSDSGFSAFFLPADEYDEAIAINAIKCALALKDQIADLSREWKIRKSWLHDIELNMGIHHDNDYVGILTSSLGDSLTSFGSVLNIATGLSRLFHGGQIWATKTLIDRIPLTVQSQLRFGIHCPDSLHRQVFIQGSFNNVRDLAGNLHQSMEFCKELEGVAVTRIYDLQVIVPD